MANQPESTRLLFIRKAIPETAWPELCVMLLDAMQEQQNQINQLISLAKKHTELFDILNTWMKEVKR